MPWEPITTIEQLIARFENSSFDYKTTYDLTEKATRYDIAKDVAAFANAFGGSIVVGVKEGGGKAVRLDGVSDVAKLTGEVATALQKCCAPIPSTPDEYAIQVSPSEARRLLVSGAAPPSADVTIVTLNVRPDPRGPVGVKPLDEQTEQPLDGAYRFPVRIDDQTRFLDPTELPIWMNSHERRIAIQLRRIEGSDGARRVRAFHTRYRAEDGDLRMLRLKSVDEVQLIAAFDSVEHPDGAEGEVHIPLALISAVWRDALDLVWSMKVEGTVFPSRERHAFHPNRG